VRLKRNLFRRIYGQPLIVIVSVVNQNRSQRPALLTQVSPKGVNGMEAMKTLVIWQIFGKHFGTS